MLLLLELTVQNKNDKINKYAKDNKTNNILMNLGTYILMSHF